VPDDEQGGKAARRLEVARRILDARRKRGLSQRELAEQLAVPLGTVDRLEQGLLDPADLLAPLSKVLGQPMSLLLNGLGNEEDLAILEVRLRDVDRGMAALAREREELGRRSASLDERELAQLNDAALLEARAADLERREGAIKERAAALSAREASISDLEAELRLRTAEIARDAEKLVAAEEVVAAGQAKLAIERRILEAMRIGIQTHATIQTHLAKSHNVWARWTLPEIRSWVDQNGASHPGRQEEWLTCLRELEEFANSDGRLPTAFQGLIEAVFSPLVEDNARGDEEPASRTESTEEFSGSDSADGTGDERPGDLDLVGGPDQRGGLFERVQWVQQPRDRSDAGER
jgi:transcriptional regulator with XRE-family HTH domain